MNPRTLRHAFTRKTILLLVAGGITMSATGVSLIGGALLIGFSFAAGLVWANRDGLAEQLQWNDAKRNHGINRELKLGEFQALKTIQAYCNRVTLEVFEPELAKEIMEQGWTLVKNATGQNATKELEALIESFPPVLANQNGSPVDDLSNRLTESVERRERIEEELDHIDL